MKDEGFGTVVLEAAAKLMVPFILIFALYVLFHGHYSPGGGFQGGTLGAAAVVLMRLICGDKSWGLSREAALLLACVGVGLYAALGVGPMLFGGAFLDYGALPIPGPTAHARALATMGVEAGIAFGVMGVMILIFDTLSKEES